MFRFDDELDRERLNYTEYNPPEYNVVPRYYEDDRGKGFEVEVYVDQDESLAATLALSARTIGFVALHEQESLRGGNGVDFIDATYYRHDGEKLGEVRLAPEPSADYAMGNITAKEYANSDETISSFNATHPDAQSVEDRNMTRLSREGHLRLWAYEYEHLLLEYYGDELLVNSTAVDVKNEELHVHTYIPEWPEDTSSSSPMAMETHTTDITRALTGLDSTSEFEPEEGVYVYQENKVLFDGYNHPNRSSAMIYVDMDEARAATSDGAETNEAYQWAAEATWDNAYFYRGHEPEDPFSRSLAEWHKSELAFENGEERDPPEDD